jgi:hypothetical protein
VTPRRRRDATPAEPIIATPSMLTQQVEYVDPARLVPHPDNPNRGNLESIITSMRRNGFYGALVVQRSSGYVIAGNHRLQAAKEIGYGEVPVLYVDVSDAKAREILIADNRTAELAHRDPTALLALLDDIGREDATALAGVGYQPEDMEDLRERAAALDQTLADQQTDNARRGAMLRTLNVSVREPDYEVHHGDVFKLGGWLTLCVKNPITEWETIFPYLRAGDRFFPFPGAYTPFLLDKAPAVAAQPNLYTAAFMLDRYREHHGPDAIERLS